MSDSVLAFLLGASSLVNFTPVFLSLATLARMFWISLFFLLEEILSGRKISWSQMDQLLFPSHP